MNATYLILVNLYLAGWLGFYTLIFSKSTRFQMGRYVLLTGIFLSLALPLIHFSPEMDLVTGQVTPGMLAGQGSGVALAAASPAVAGSHFPVWPLLVTVYWTGVAVMSFLFARKLYGLYRLLKKYPHRHYCHHTHVITDHHRDIFSFGKYLFAPHDTPWMIYKHELVHIIERHSVDNLLLEGIKIFCWFNPAVYRYQRTMKTIHEYIADARTTRSASKSQYAHLLVGYWLRAGQAPLVHRFYNRSQLQKRLIMLQKKTASNTSFWASWLITALVAGGIVVFSSSFALHDKLDHVLSTIPRANAAEPVEVSGRITNMVGVPLSGVTIVKIGTSEGTVSNKTGHFKIRVPAHGMLQFSMIGYTTVAVPVDGHQSLTIVMYEDPHRIDEIVVVGYAKGQKPPSSKPETKAPKVFTFVEQMPQFPGGKSALFKFLSENIRYPQAARAGHLEGSVLVGFIVGKDGSIANIHTISKEIGGGLEQEAVRVVEKMPKWKPGRQNGQAVDVLYTLPVKFVLQ